MPKISKVFELEVSPDKFLANCSPEELYETWLLINNNRYQSLINKIESGSSLNHSKNIDIRDSCPENLNYH